MCRLQNSYLPFSIDHVLNDGIPLIQNDEDEGQARELPDIVLAKDMAVDSESIFGTLLSLNSKMSGKQSIKAMSNVVDNKSTLRPYGFMDPATY